MPNSYVFDIISQVEFDIFSSICDYIISLSNYHRFYHTCFSKLQYRRPAFHLSVRPQFTSNPNIYVHLNDLFSQTTASMNLKLHLQHDQTARLQNNKT